VRSKRTPVEAENPFVAMEKQFSDLIEDSLDHYRDQRDQFYEQAFQGLFESPWLSTLLGARRARRGPISLRAQLERLNIKSAMRDFDHGGALDAFARVVAFVRGDGVIDVRPFNMMRRILSEQRVEPVTLAEYRDSVQRQSFVLLLDEERALEGLLKLLPEAEMRHTVMDFVLEVLSAAGPLDAVSATRYQRVKQLLGLADAPKLDAPEAPPEPEPEAWLVEPPKAAAPAKPKAPVRKRAPAKSKPVVPTKH
jgi:hypothetical protein